VAAHEQVRQVLLEVENVNKVAGAACSAVVLASRRHLCLNDRCSRLSARDAMAAYRVLREHGDSVIRWNSRPTCELGMGAPLIPGKNRRRSYVNVYPREICTLGSVTWIPVIPHSGNARLSNPIWFGRNAETCPLAEYLVTYNALT
jgi:hypothetical protein